MTSHTNAAKKILIVEDNATLSTLLSNQLEGEGFEVSTAKNGQEGLTKILEEKPDAVILDIMMPKKDGISLLQDLHAKDPNNKTPIIVLTNVTDMEHIASAMTHRAVAYLAKSDQDLHNIITILREKLGLTSGPAKQE